MLIAPIKNESNEVVLFILNFEDITDAPYKKESYRNALKNSEQSPRPWGGRVGDAVIKIKIVSAYY